MIPHHSWWWHHHSSLWRMHCCILPTFGSTLVMDVAGRGWKYWVKSSFPSFLLNLNCNLNQTSMMLWCGGVRVKLNVNTFGRTYDFWSSHPVQMTVRYISTCSPCTTVSANSMLHCYVPEKWSELPPLVFWVIGCHILHLALFSFPVM